MNDIVGKIVVQFQYRSSEELSRETCLSPSGVSLSASKARVWSAQIQVVFYIPGGEVVVALWLSQMTPGALNDNSAQNQSVGRAQHVHATSSTLD